VASIQVYLVVKNNNPDVRIVPGPVAVEAINREAVTRAERSPAIIFPSLPHGQGYRNVV
jgi:hypothetical protein